MLETSRSDTVAPSGARHHRLRLPAALAVVALLAALLTAVMASPAGTQTGEPFGWVDRIDTDTDSATVVGWAIDPDTTAPADIHIYVDGTFTHGLTADRNRPDVADAHPAYGPAHGFARTIPLDPGTHQICTYALDTTGGPNPLLACRTITVGTGSGGDDGSPDGGPSGEPFGWVDRIDTDTDSATVVGWAIDPDTTAPTDIHIYVDGTFTHGLTADRNRPDVADAHPAYGPAHGFARTIPLEAGTHQICTYALDTTGGPNPLLACRTVTVFSDSRPVGDAVLPGSLVVAHYGSATSPVLGVLGETSPAAAAAAVAERAEAWEGLGRPVVPAFEFIATVATASPGPDGDYSNPLDVATIRPWLDAVRSVGGILILDIQPGTSDFLSQVRLYESLLIEPDVGLALDPEWRMPPGVPPATQIGSVDSSEINEVSAYLADLVAIHDLPRKPFLIHQFTASMVTNRNQLIARPELATLIHLDGFGSPAQKIAKYDALHAESPLLNGFKLFLDEDTRLMSPTEVLSELDPDPDYVSYQ